MRSHFKNKFKSAHISGLVHLFSGEGGVQVLCERTPAVSVQVDVRVVSAQNQQPLYPRSIHV